MASELLTVQSYQWQEEEYNTENGCTNIWSWALDQDSNPYLLKILNFPQMCYVELPTIVNNREFRWTNNKVAGPKIDYQHTIQSYLQQLLGNDAPTKMRLVFKPKLYYFQNNKTKPFVQMLFKNKDNMTKCISKLQKPLTINNKTFNFRVWEDKISVIRKLLTLRELKYTQWFTVKAIKVDQQDKLSTLEREYTIDFSSITLLDDEQTKGWYTHPGLLVIDGEMYSHNKKMMPQKRVAQDTCYMLSCIYQRFGKPETRQKYIIVIGECPDIEGTTIIRCKNELELTNEFAKLVMDLDPEIMSGYNIAGFDIPYLDARRKRTFVDWPQMGRIVGRNAYVKSLNWESSGSGYNDINTLVMDGRINFDALHLARRELKLPKYDLNTVAKTVVGESKHDISAQEMFVIYEELQHTKRMMDNVNKFKDRTAPEVIEQAEQRRTESLNKFKQVAEYCVQDSELVVELFEKWKTWIYLIELAKIVGVNPADLFTRGQQIRVLHQVYDLACRKGYVIDKRDLPEVEWAGGFVFEPKPGLYDFVICLDFKSLYPSIIIAFNLCYTTLVPPEMDKYIPDEECNVIEWDEEIDKDSKNLLNDNDTNYNGSGEGNEGNESDDEDDEGNKVVNKKVIHCRYKFVKPILDEQGNATARSGLMPQLVQYLIDERNKVRREQKKYNELTDPYWTILEKRQLGLKVTANSFFGALGAQRGGKLPLVEVARVITAKGRELITLCNKYVEDKYGALVVYNDTDSTMFTIPGVDNYADCIDWGFKLEKELSNKFASEGRKALYTEFEKGGRMFAIKKKKYAYWQTYLKNNEEKGQVKGEFIPADEDGILMKGIVLARRDNCKFQRDTYREVLMNILTRQSMQSTLDIIVKRITQLYCNTVEWPDLTIIRGLGSHYKSQTYFMKIFGDELARIGKPATPGERLEYVVCKKPEEEQHPDHFKLKVKLGYKMRLPETYLERLNTSEHENIDTLYYIFKVMMNCIEQLWQIGYNKELAEIAKKNEYEDKCKIINYCASMDETRRTKMLELWNYAASYNLNQEQVIEWVYENMFEYEGMKTKAKEAKSAVVGKNACNAHITTKPIKKLYNAAVRQNNGRDDYLQYIKVLATPEVATELNTMVQSKFNNNNVVS